MAHNKTIKSDSPPLDERISQFSHDFRGGLYVIIGASELLLEETVGEINEEQRVGLNDILERGQRLLRLMNQLEKT